MLKEVQNKLKNDYELNLKDNLNRITKNEEQFNIEKNELKVKLNQVTKNIELFNLENKELKVKIKSSY